MDFREFRHDKRTQTKPSKKEVFETDFGSILENLDQEIDSGYHQDFSRNDSKEFRPKFLGKLYESPNPLEYPEGTMYKNTRNGVVYIKEGESWELLVEDGKNGSVGPQGQAGGSGAGVKEVQSIVDTSIQTVTNYLKPSYNDVLVITGIQTSASMVTFQNVTKPILFDNVIFPRGEFTLSSTNIEFRGTCQGLSGATIFKVGGEFRLFGTREGNTYLNDCKDIAFKIDPYSINFDIDGLKFTSIKEFQYWVDPNWAGYCIKYLRTDDGTCPKYGNLHNCYQYKRSGLYSILGAEQCKFYDNVSEAGYWNFHVISSKNSIYRDETSLSGTVLSAHSRPVVGFLNMHTPMDTSTSSLELVGNRYENITINGWLEEGFSFDVGWSGYFVGSSKLVSVSGTTITVTSAISGAKVGDYVNVGTGKRAGDYYKILGISADYRSFVMDRTFPTSLLTSGDFMCIEHPCHSNVVSNCNFISNGDLDGVCVWGHGGRTTFRDNYFKGCRFFIISYGKNIDGITYVSPNKLYFDGNSIDYPNSGYYTNFSSDGALFTSANLSDASIDLGTYKLAQTHFGKRDSGIFGWANHLMIADYILPNDGINNQLSATPTFWPYNKTRHALTYSQKSTMTPYLGQEIVLIDNDGFTYQTTQRYVTSGWTNI